MIGNPKLPPIVAQIEALYCCCAKPDCIALAHNNQVMHQLEYDLLTAAKLGQHLLERHDRYVEEVEVERQRFEEAIQRQNVFAELVDQLEDSNRDLEDQNLRSMMENAELLKRLELLHSSLNSADQHNEELRSDLIKTENHVGVLTHKAARTRDLESDVAALESEKVELEQELVGMTASTRQSDQRYREAEAKITALHQQLNHIMKSDCGELDHKPRNRSSERHKVAQLPEQESPCLAQLSGSTDRLSTSLSSNSALEQDTAELRRILADSQDEISQLREQLALRRAKIPAPGHDGPRKTMSQELHQHHHYHYHVPAKQGEKKAKSRNSAAPKRESHLTMGAPLAYSTPPHALMPSQHKRSLSNDSTLSWTVEPTTCSSPPENLGKTRQQRDSGYFSFASSSGLDHNPLTPASPFSTTDQDNLFEATVKSQFGRSNSFESIFALESACLPTSVGRDLVMIPNFEGTVGGRSVRPVKSHESFINEVTRNPLTHKLPQKFAIPRRPYASPLQNTATEATVSVTSANVYNPERTGFATNSLNSLRNASGGKTTSPGHSGSSLGAAKAIFRRNHSDKKVPTISRSSKWSFAGWNSSAIKGEQASEPVVDTSKGSSALKTDQLATDVKVSTIDENLLHEALGY